MAAERPVQPPLPSAFRAPVFVGVALAGLLLVCPLAHAGSAPDVPAPTCVKWCGNDAEPEQSAPSRSSPKHHKHTAPMPDIDVGAMMDAAQARKKKAKQQEQAAARAADAVRLQQEAQQRAADQARQNEERKGIQNMKIKGGELAAPNNIQIKHAPPAPPRTASAPPGSARSQLDCAARIAAQTAGQARAGELHKDPAQENWQQRPGDCTPPPTAIPEPPAPTRVETAANAQNDWLDALFKQMSEKRETLNRLDQEIAAKEQQVAQEQLKVVNADRGESDAMRRAREALEKARADRARTADELAKLEQQEQEARKHTRTPAAH